MNAARSRLFSRYEPGGDDPFSLHENRSFSLQNRMVFAMPETD
jgi:hypothetical protein